MADTLQKLHFGTLNPCNNFRLSLIFFFLLSSLDPVFAKVYRLDSGELEGILTQKSKNWIDVRDDRGYINRYLPYWVGDSPSRGGEFDPSMVQQIADLIVGNRVYLKWVWDGHLRIDRVEVTEPSEKSGMFEGYLLEVGDKWIDVQNHREGRPWRFYLPWLGGYPENGGGYDREMLRFFHDHNPRLPVYFDWVYDLRPRITRILKFEEAKFVPFFAGKEEVTEVLLRSGDKKEQASPGNPFEQASPGNPFEQASPGNPFEQASPGNPFEQASPSNPFENVPLPNGG